MSELPAAMVRDLETRADVVVAWLYGSMARGDDHAGSDIDLAVAFRTPSDEPWERVDALRARLAAKADRALSVVDINRAPTPLAYNIITEGRLVLCREPLRLHGEQQRIWSLWEAWRGEHERHRARA